MPPMLTWLVLAGLALAGGGLAARRAARSRVQPARLPTRKEASPTGLLERTLADVRLGDVVQEGPRDWLVEGLVHYDEDGRTWHAARLVDGGEEAWLFVGLERGAGLDLRLLRRTSRVDLAGYPPDAIEHDRKTYRLARRGTATGRWEGDVGDLGREEASRRCRWWRYQAAEEAFLLVEQWGEPYRTLEGKLVSTEEMELLAAS